ncbi:MAG: SUMF1/EgtB/PvdO family nonheme iron enzyme [Planctomycetes bacterium]|nr:SUMF1/EgtB/PvdO family nonheme iron enzyme [Planctomycetota bacterium]
MNEPTDGRRIAGERLLGALRAARARTLEATVSLTDEQWLVPYHPGIQPTAWDLAHIAWFHELWNLRGPHRILHDGTIAADGAARFFPEDHYYDSARITHPSRWEIPLYPRNRLLERMQDQLEACCEHVAGLDADDDSLYYMRLGLYHELMHHEALLWTRDLLALPGFADYGMRRLQAAPPHRQQGGEFVLGRPPGTAGFAFDNETPGRRVELAPYSIDANPVSNGEFLAFVMADGYHKDELWPGTAGRFRRGIGRDHPERWRRTADGEFEQRWFDSWRPLVLDEPVIHVSAYEAEAYCLYVGRRLPTAAEWEVAADDIDWGHSVWEWTADPFAPYPAFRPGPYSTYSAPWFHRQREMRGGAFATDALLHDRTYRNFFLPYRTDVFAGFRTAADER